MADHALTDLCYTGFARPQEQGTCYRSITDGNQSPEASILVRSRRGDGCHPEIDSKPRRWEKPSAWPRHRVVGTHVPWGGVRTRQSLGRRDLQTVRLRGDGPYRALWYDPGGLGAVVLISDVFVVVVVVVVIVVVVVFVNDTDTSCALPTRRHPSSVVVGILFRCLLSLPFVVVTVVATSLAAACVIVVAGRSLVVKSRNVGRRRNIDCFCCCFVVIIIGENKYMR